MAKNMTKRAAVAHAQKGWHPTTLTLTSPIPCVNNKDDSTLPEPTEVMSWESGVNNVATDDEWTDSEGQLDDGNVEMIELT